MQPVSELKILIENSQLLCKGQIIAKLLDLVIICDRTEAFSTSEEICVVYDLYGIGLLYIDATKPIYVDFTDPKKLHRIKTVHQEALCKAIKIKSIPCPNVIDATAGMGEDSFILAASNCKVLMLERSGIIGKMLENGLERALTAESVRNIASSLSLKLGNSIELLKNLTSDVIYIDPMFPERKKSALVKKEMRAFKSLVGFDEDSDELLKISLMRAKHKVVVKRPIEAPFIADLQSTYSINGKVCRFDIYQI